MVSVARVPSFQQVEKQFPQVGQSRSLVRGANISRERHGPLDRFPSLARNPHYFLMFGDARAAAEPLVIYV